MKDRPAKIVCLFVFLALANSARLCAQAGANAVVAKATNAVVSVPLPAATNAAPVAQPVKPHPLTLIESDGPADFDLGGREVVYHDHVRVDSPEMKLSCEWLAADVPQDGGHVTNIVAETNVVIDATDDKGQKLHATGARAVYVYAVQNGATNETVTLTGSARVEYAQDVLTGDVINWDRAHNHLSVPNNPKMIIHENFNSPAAGANSPPATNPPANMTNLSPAFHRSAVDTNFPPAKSELVPERHDPLLDH